MRISTWPKIGVLAITLALMGQSCSPFSLTSSSKPLNDGGVYRSDDHGQTWKQKSLGVSGDTKGIRFASVRVLNFDPRNPDRLTVGTYDQGIWNSSNAGDSWRASSIAAGAVPCIAVKSSDPDVQFAAYGGTVQKSIDNGQTWHAVYSDGQRQAVTCVATDRSTPTTVWATTSGGKLMRSNDDGKSWAIALALKAMTPRRIVQDDQLPGHLIIFTRLNGIMDVDVVNNSWQDLSGALKQFHGGNTINGVSIIFGSPSVWTIATAYGLLQSYDRGTTWTVLPTLVTPGTTAIQNVAVNPRDPQEMLITVGNKLHHTRDAGKTWTIMPIPTSRMPVSLMFDPVRIDRIFVGTFYVQPT